MNHPHLFRFLPTTFAFALLYGIMTSSCAALFEARMDAETAYQKKQYTVAADLLQEDYKASNDLLAKSKIAYKIAECYRLANKTEQAENWYKNTIEYADLPDASFKYALMLKTNGKYNEAIALFKEFMLAVPTERDKGAEQMQSCRQASEWLKKPLPYRITNLQTLNSNASDFAPTLINKDQLVFTSDRAEATGDKKYGWTGEKHADLFAANRQKDGWFANPTLWGDSINTDYNEGTASFTANGQVVYFTACGGTPDERDDFCQIYTSYKDPNANKWTLPERVNLFESDTVNVGQPCVSPDGAELYFATDVSGGYGNKDIYVVRRMKDGLWSEPENLGAEINTAGYEGFPALGVDGKLYFASDGHLGMGGLDLFTADRRGKKWFNAQNLQSPINSAADDFGLIYEPAVSPELLDSIEAIGYFASSRKGGKGSDDLYQFVRTTPPKDLPPPTTLPPTPPVAQQTVYLLLGRIQKQLFKIPDDPNSGTSGIQPLPDAAVQILGLSTESTISKRLLSNTKGEFSIIVEKDTDYKLTASQAGYFTRSEIVNTQKTPTAGNDTVRIYAEITLDKIFKRKEIVLQNIYYDLDKSDIREDAKPTLNKLAQLLRENPSIRIELGSHTDSRGSSSYNQKLSLARAQAALSYLASQGIDPTRLSAQGYGENLLINRCADGVACNDEEHQQNRRTTFKVISD